MNTLYLECGSGISGDMTVAALLDLGADKQVLCDALERIGAEGYHLHFGRVNKQGIDAYDFDVHLEEKGGEVHEHHHDHGEVHEHHHDHGETGHSHVHRNLADVTALIESAAISPAVKVTAISIFRRVAQAEAKVHGKPIEQVMFHEVGAVDSIVDIVGTAVCLDNLNIGTVYCSPLCEGQGTVRCAHGIMPVPAPATAEIAAAGGLTLTITEERGEMVTPTGAAIAAALSKGKPPRSFRILKTGYGAGKKDFRRANILRAHLIETEDSDAFSTGDTVCKLESNIDNTTGEQLGFAMERLLEAGALDVWFTPIQMKKNRPATLLSVLCKPEDADRLSACVLRHTGTIGVRRSRWDRMVMDREPGSVDTPYGPVEVKRAMAGDLRKVAAEYESARRTAIQNEKPLKEIYTAAEQD